MKKILLGTALLALAGSASAVGVGVRAGTTGVGADVAIGVAPMVSARVGLSAFNYTRNFNDGDFKYDGKLQLKNTSLLLDFSPPVMPLRVSAGIVATGNKIDVTGTPANDKYTINGQTYLASEIGSVNGQIKGSRSTAPYLGIGWGNVAGTGFNFYGDLGVMFMGGGKAALNVNCGTLIAGTPRCDQAKADGEAERKKLEDDVKSFKYFPVINIGVTVGF